MNFYAAGALFNLINSALLGTFVYFKNPRQAINKSYGILSLSLAFWSANYFLWQIDNNDKLALLHIRLLSLGAVFIPVFFLYFILCLLKEQKERSRLLTVAFLTAILFSPFTFTSLFITGVKQKLSFPFWPDAGIMYSAFLCFFFICVVYAMYQVIRSYRRSEGYKQSQIWYVLVASAVGFLGGMTNYPLWYDIKVLPVFNFLVGVHVLILAYAIVKYREFDIETVIHKTIAWFLTNLTLIIPFLIIVYLLRAWLYEVHKIIFFGFVGGLSLFSIFLLRLIQPKMDRVFLRGRVNAEKVAGQFSEELIRLEGIPNLVSRIESIIADTIYPQHIDVLIHDGEKKMFWHANRGYAPASMSALNTDNPFLQWLAENDQIVHREHVDMDPAYGSIKEDAKQYFESFGAYVAVPLAVKQQLIGVINLSKKANLKRYTSVDFHFLRLIKNQAAIALSNSLLYENMEGQVRQRTKQLEGTQKQLVHAEKLATMGTLAGGVAHEINNPLTAILTNVQMLLADDAVKDASDKESLQLIEEATKRCRSIVQKLMAYARKPLETGEPLPVDLLKVIKNVIAFIGYQLEQENIKIVTDIKKEDTYIVAGNQNELEQVITNIVLNAKDAIQKVRKSGNIYLSLSKEKDRVKIQIKDEGIGISKETLSKVFDPFFTTKEVGKGMGLGLSICQAIVERHNGRITVESELNKGSVFTLQFPAVRIGSVDRK